MSGLQVQKTVTVPVGATKVSEKFAVGDFSRGSFIATAAFTGDVNFDVSNDGTTWETLSNAAASFTDITSPAAGKARALPATLFSFKYARLHTSANQTTADGVAQLNLFGGA